MMNLANLRNEFIKETLSLNDLCPNPFLQFEEWFQTVLAAEIKEPNAMSIATATSTAQPSLRTVLLKYFDEKGFVFYTNYESKKAKEMEDNPQVALLFFWKELERQIIILGKVEKVSRLETMKYFASRPRASQIGAWVSSQSKIISNKSLILQKFAQIKDKFKKGTVPVPDFWGGYRVVPESFEFWQGGQHRLHDRFLYTYDMDRNWKIERLAP